MSDVDKVALWLGLIGGVISIVLAIVAMAFTFAVDRRSSRINEQMIASLQKIESTVEGVASDTTGLIKVAWDRMLPGVGPASTDLTVGGDGESVHAIAAGVAAELKSELSSQPGADPEALRRLDEAMRRLERSVAAQLQSASDTSAGARLQRLTQSLDRLGPEARALVDALAKGGVHLTRKQYMGLRVGSLAPAVGELRRSGILVPLQDAEESAEPVYWLSPNVYQSVTPLLQLFEPIPASARARVMKELARVGYVPGDLDASGSS